LSTLIPHGLLLVAVRAMCILCNVINSVLLELACCENYIRYVHIHLLQMYNIEKIHAFNVGLLEVFKSITKGLALLDGVQLKSRKVSVLESLPNTEVHCLIIASLHFDEVIGAIH